MRYVITGATSFIGIELIELLQYKGQDVVAVCLPCSKGIYKIPAGVEVVTAEMTDYVNLHRDISQADVFINLAWGGTGHDGRDNVNVQKENVASTIAAFSAANKMGCKLFVEAGSQAEYGSTIEPQQENMECHPFSEYGKAKLKVKEKLFKLSEQLNMKYIHLRIFSLFGENDHPWTLVMSAIDKMLKDETVDLSPCSQNWNFLYVKDAAKQIVGLCEYAFANNKFTHEVYNIASDDTRKLKEFVEEIKIITNSTSELNYGAITPTYIVSLQPNISKLKNTRCDFTYSTFKNVILKIKKNKYGK